MNYIRENRNAYSTDANYLNTQYPNIEVNR